MPHYGGWSWPLASLGPLDEAIGRINVVERDIESRGGWSAKIDKAVWRGTPWFNPDWRMGLRHMLLEVAGTRTLDDGSKQDRPWADVKTFTAPGQPDGLSAEDFCRYKYIIYTEVCKTGEG